MLKDICFDKSYINLKHIFIVCHYLSLGLYLYCYFTLSDKDFSPPGPRLTIFLLCNSLYLFNLYYEYFYCSVLVASVYEVVDGGAVGPLTLLLNNPLLSFNN